MYGPRMPGLYWSEVSSRGYWLSVITKAVGFAALNKVAELPNGVVVCPRTLLNEPVIVVSETVSMVSTPEMARNARSVLPPSWR